MKNIQSIDISAFLAVESELGGSGGTGAGPVMKNVVEDYLKLLLIRCQYRVMVFTSLASANEEKHICNRVETLRLLYLKCQPSLDSGVLLVHLSGEQPKSKQVQACVNQESISGLVISNNGLSVKVIDLTKK